MKGIDCTNTITELIGKSLIGSGIGFVCRYLVPERLAWKRLTKAEAETLTDLGLQIVSVYETTANRAAGGSANGTADGKEAFGEAQIVGQPKGSTVYFAVDYDAQSAGYNAIEAYLRAAATEMPRYEIGVYGAYAVVEEMAKRGACKHFWQTYAWSNGKLSKYANVYQNKNGVTMAGIQCDLNDSYGNEGWWNLKMLLDWKQIVEKVASNPAEWEAAINTAVNAAQADGNLGDLEIFKFLPELIVKVYNFGANK